MSFQAGLKARMAHKPEQWLSWTLSILIIVLMGGYGVLQVLSQQHELQKASERRGRALAEGLSLIGATAVMDNLFLVQEAIMTQIQGDPEIQNILVLDNDHMVIASSDLTMIGETLFPSVLQNTEMGTEQKTVIAVQEEIQDRLVVFSPLQGENELLGWIRVELSLEHVKQEAFRNLFKQGFFSILLVAITIFLVRKTISRLSYALQTSENKTRQVIDHALDAVVGMDSQGNITDWNDQAEITFGWKREEALRQNLAQLIIPFEFREAHQSGLEHFLETGESKILSQRIEVESCHKSGHRFPVELSISPIKLEDGNWSFHAFVRDITEQKKASEALRVETSYIRLLQEAAVAANEAEAVEFALHKTLELVCRFTGWPVGHVYLRPDDLSERLEPSGIWHLDDSQRFETFREVTERTTFSSGDGLPGLVLATGEAAWIADVTQASNFPRARYVENLQIKGGFAFPVLVKGNVIAVLEFFSIQHEDPNPRWLEVVNIIGTQLGHVVERKQAEAALAETNARIQAIVGTAADAIITINEQGLIDTFNRAAEHIFGYASSEVLGHNVSRLMPPPYSEEHDGYLARYFKTGESRILGTSRELVGKRKDGTTFPVEIAFSQVQLGNRRVFTGILRDITDRKNSVADLAEARDKALEAVRLKSEFLATMSHEIRTPMNGVIGMTGLLLETPLSPEQQRYAEVVRSSGEALLTVINDILDFSKIESGKLEMETIDFDLRVAVEEALELFAEKAAAKRLELVGLVYADVPTALRGDPGRLRQILLNLVGNAIKFTQEGEVTVQVWRLEETESAVVLRFQVADTGIGINPEASARLFQPFSQADSSTTRKYGGTGLGLAISKQLVQQMDGEIGVNSTPGEGSVFWFRVKLQKQNNPTTQNRNPLTNLKGLRVCCVDDHSTNRYLLVQYCKEWEMEGSIAATPREALSVMQAAAARGTPIDVAILDMQMPEMDGVTLAKTIKADPQLAQTKLVLVTSLGNRGDAQIAKDAGFAGYLTKPLRKEELRACLQLVSVKEPLESHSILQPLVTQHTVREVTSQRKARLLVADDHTVNQQLAVLMLERLGHRVDVVANGQEAVEAMSRKDYDLVFMDCQMPEMDGYTATKEIRHIQGPETRTPIIAMTANAMQGDREKCLAAGMDDYVSKPIKPQALEQVLERWLPRIQAITKVQEQPVITTEEDSGGTHKDLVEQPSFDESVLTELEALGGADLMSRIVQQFIWDATASVEAVQRSMISEDTPSLAEAAHGLKGICGNIGARRLSDLAFNLEQQSKAKNMESVLAIIENLQMEFKQVEQHLQNRVAQATRSDESN